MQMRQDSTEILTDLERRAQFLRILNRGWLLVGTIGMIAYPFYPLERPMLITVILLTLSTFLLVRALNNRGSTVFAGFLFTLLVNFSFLAYYIVSAAQLGMTEALESRMYILFMTGIAITFAGALIHRWAAFSLAALDSVLLIYLVNISASASDPFINVHVFWWMLALCVWLYEDTLRAAYGRLNQNRRTLEEQVQARTASLQTLVNQLDLTRKRLVDANAELEAFVYSVSHDLRAPLRAIDGYSIALQEDSQEMLPEQSQHNLSRVRANVQTMNRLIDDLLKLSRLDRQPLVTKQVDLQAMTQEIIAELCSENPDREVQFQAASLLPVYADRVLLHQVVYNLLSNAVKFTRHSQPAVIEMRSREENQEIIVSIKDNGAGFDMTQVHRLFTPFQRLHSASEYEGTGIGLTIVRRIIKRLGGRTWAESQADQGACFYFSLPTEPNPDTLDHLATANITTAPNPKPTERTTP
jgi:two-component system sensor kinase